jgi:hypothetical protein
MAVAFGTVVNVTPGTGANTGASPSITTPTTNPVVVVHVALQSTTATVTSLTITGFGGTSAEVKNARTALDGSDAYISIWSIKAPTANTAGTVQANLSASVPFQMAVTTYSGADQTDPCPTGDAVSDVTRSVGVTLTPTNLTASDATSGSNANSSNGFQDCSTPTPNSRYVGNTTTINEAVGDNTGTSGVVLGGTNGNATAKAAVRVQAVTTGAAAPVAYRGRRSPRIKAPKRGPFTGRAYREVPPAGMSGIAGATVDDVTLASTATLMLQATAADTVDDVTLASTATLNTPIASRGRRAPRIGPKRGPFAGKAYREVPTPSVVPSGTAAITVDDVTLASTATLMLQAAAADTAADVTLASTATLMLQAAAAITVADVTLASTATLKIQGTAAPTVADVTLASTATLKLQATSAMTVADVTLASTATLKLQAAAAITAADVVMSAADTLLIQAQAAINDAAVTLSSASTLKIQATSAITVNDVTLAATGVGAVPILADAAITVADTTLASASTLKLQAAAAMTAAAVTMVAAALGQPPSVSVQKDGDPDYWNLPWFNVEGETFADKLRKKTLIALDEAIEEAESGTAPAAVKAVRRYVKVAGPLLSDTEAAELGKLAQQLSRAASQKQNELARQKARDTRALMIAQMLQQDEEEALIALGIY